MEDQGRLRILEDGLSSWETSLNPKVLLLLGKLAPSAEIVGKSWLRKGYVSRTGCREILRLWELKYISLYCKKRIMVMYNSMQI